MDSCLDLQFDERKTLDGATRGDEVSLANPQADDVTNATAILAAIEAGNPTAAEQFLVPCNI
jgi:hypothetical protein